MKKSIYLDESENLAIQLLAKGERLKIIRESCKIPSTRFPFFLAELRRKTGISNIQDTRECAKYWKDLPNLKGEVQISPQESRLLVGFVDLVSLAYMANMLRISEADARASLENALRKCGIFVKDDRTRRIQVRFFFAIKGIPHSKLPPLSSEHWKVLRVLADGGRLEHVQALWTPPKKAKFAREYIREACIRIGANCPGRGARQKLIAAFLNAHATRSRYQSGVANRLDVSEITPEQYSNFFQRKLGITLEGLAEDIGCSLEEAMEAGLKMCKRARFDCSEEAIRAHTPKEEITPVTMEDPAF